MKRIRWKPLLPIAALAAVGSAAWAGLASTDPQDVREIKGQFARQASRIESLELEYRLDTTSELAPEQLLSLSEFHNQLFLPRERWTVAIRGERRFTHQLLPEQIQYLSEPDEFGLVPPRPPDPRAPGWVRKHQQSLKDQYNRATATLKEQQARTGRETARKPPGTLGPMERDITRAFNGRTLWMRRPIDDKSREVQVWPAGKKPLHWFGPSAYLMATGLQPADPTSKGHESQSIQKMYRLVEWFRDNPYTLEKTEMIDSSTCVVLKANLNSLLNPALISGEVADRIWLDRDHGMAVRRREMSKDGKVHTRWENSAFREVLPGLWLPMEVRHERFGADAPADWGNKPAIVEEIRVDRIDLNAVPDERFDLVPRKGDTVEDLRGRF
ncbi:MAG: hypothetical protein U0800_23630 [Isosphaeraceae bacterium]